MWQRIARTWRLHRRFLDRLLLAHDGRGLVSVLHVQSQWPGLCCLVGHDVRCHVFCELYSAI